MLCLCLHVLDRTHLGGGNITAKMTATIVLSITIHVTYHNRVMTVAMTVATTVTVGRGDWVKSTQTIVREDSHLVQCIGCPCRKKLADLIGSLRSDCKPPSSAVSAIHSTVTRAPLSHFLLRSPLPTVGEQQTHQWALRTDGIYACPCWSPCAAMM